MAVRSASYASRICQWRGLAWGGACDSKWSSSLQATSYLAVNQQEISGLAKLENCSYDSYSLNGAESATPINTFLINAHSNLNFAEQASHRYGHWKEKERLSSR